jgi:hypothetical protein
MMDEKRKKDEALLIDYLLGRCNEATRREIELRLEKEPELQASRTDIANSFDALKLLAEPEESEGLADRTLARIASARQATAARTRQELMRGGRPTFSLRELGTVAAAAIIMAMLFVPWARQARNRALQGKCAANVGQIGTGMKNYAMDNEDSLPTAHTSNAAWLPGSGRKPISNSAGLFRLVGGSYAPSGVFQCAADSDAAGDSFDENNKMTDFPESKYISYSYHYALCGKSLSSSYREIAVVADQMAVLSD